MRSSTFPSQDHEVTPIKSPRHSVPGPPTSTPMIDPALVRKYSLPKNTLVVEDPASTAAASDSLTMSLDKFAEDSKLMNNFRQRTSDTVRAVVTEEFNNLSPTESNSSFLVTNDDKRELNRSESFSPPASFNPFGSREQRASFRRYEIEQMQRRPLPQTHSSGSEDENTFATPDASTPWTGGMADRLVSSERFGSREQRSSLRSMQRESSGIGMQPSGTGLRRSNSDKR